MSKPTEESPHYVDEEREAHLQTSMQWSMRYQEEYQAALGRFLVRFNELEMTISATLEQVTIRLEVPHLFRPKEYFVQQADKVELALCAKPHWPKPDFASLRKINTLRNEVAHGHFHQNPGTGEYETRPLRNDKGVSKIIEPAIVDTHTDKVIKALADVGRVFPWVVFGDVTPVLPPGAIPIPT